MQAKVFVALCLLQVAFSASVQDVNRMPPGDAADEKPAACQCVPDEWQGVLVSTDREFDLTGGQAAATENKMKVFYDFKNKFFAMTDLTTGSRAIADYKRGLKFVTRGGICHGIRTMENMKQMCLPEGAAFLGQYTLSTTVAVDMWDYHGPYNTSMKTAVLHDDCVPVTEEIFMNRAGYVSLTSSMYLNVKLGPLPNDAFTPPSHCSIQHYGQNKMRDDHNKRSGHNPNLDLWNALRQRLYIFN